MKIICTDNFDRETENDSLVCENVNEDMGNKIVSLLLSEEHEHSPNFYKLVPDDYKLYVWEP
jgi:hypothetical protein